MTTLYTIVSNRLIWGGGRHKKCCSWHAIIPDISLEMVKRNKTQIQENWRTTKRDENCRYRLWQW